MDSHRGKKLAIETAYDTLVARLNQAKQKGDDFDQSVLERKKFVVDEAIKSVKIVNQLKGRPMNIPT